jgi:DNA repair protein RecO (recombination protein O)
MIVMHRVPFGDTSLVVQFISPGHGRVAALAKGAFREKSPFYGSLDTFDLVDAVLVRRRETSLAVLASVESSVPRRQLRRDLGALSAAFYAAELVDCAITESPHPALYRHFDRLLTFLDRSPAPAPPLARGALARFELQLLDDLGLRPVLQSCAICTGPTAGPRVAYAPSAGGVLCARCAAGMGVAGTMSAEAVATAASLQRDSSAPADAIPVDAACAREIREFLDRFHVYHLERAPKSRPAMDAFWRARNAPVESANLNQPPRLVT